ncbi:HNH endonuclease [Brachybacterium alimentarium]|nr:HNH endonuclease [Brachybacterium alimentarium]
MAWSTSDRRSRLPSEWHALRARVRRRAGGRCEWVAQDGSRCPSPGTDCDHIQPGDDHRMGNLQWLCAPHHKAKTARDNTRALAVRTQLRARPTESHPGRNTP